MPLPSRLAFYVPRSRPVASLKTPSEPPLQLMNRLPEHQLVWQSHCRHTAGLAGGRQPSTSKEQVHHRGHHRRPRFEPRRHQRRHLVPPVPPPSPRLVLAALQQVRQVIELLLVPEAQAKDLTPLIGMILVWPESLGQGCTRICNQLTVLRGVKPTAQL